MAWDYSCPLCSSDNIDAIEDFGTPLDSYTLWKCLDCNNLFTTVVVHEIVEESIKDEMVE
jgi:hypothetical protein